MPGQQTTARVGRPSEIDKIVKVNEDGSALTAGQQIIERMRLANDLHVAAASAGISTTALYKWRLDGARLRAVEAQGKRALTEREQVFVDFVNALEKAEAAWEVNKLGIIQEAAEGGYQHEKVTEKWEMVDGKLTLTEKSVVRWTAAPQWAAAMTLLERRMPYKYGRRVALTDGDGGPLISPADQAREIADSLREYLTGVEDGKRAAAPKRKAIPAESRES